MGISGVPTREINGAEQVIAYVSLSLDVAEQNYRITDIKC